MNDRTQHGAARLQSSAMVAAAFITTLGAITAACIQTGWISKPPLNNIAHTDPPIAQASVLGTIEPYHERAANVANMETPHVGEPSLAIPAATTPEITVPQLLEGGTQAPANSVQAWRTDPSTATSQQNYPPLTSQPQHVFQTSAYQSTTQLARQTQPATSPVMQPEVLRTEPAQVVAPPVTQPATFTARLVPLPQSTVAMADTKQTVAYAPTPSQPTTLLADDAAVKILPSPWSFLTKPTTGDKPADVAKTAKKPIDWGSVAAFFKGHD